MKTIGQQIFNSRLNNLEEIDFTKSWIELAEQQQTELGYEYQENELLEREYDEIMEDRVRQYEEEEYMMFGL